MLDLSAADGALRRKTQVCVIGAGVAGQTVARRLAAAGRDVLLAESGGRDFHGPTQALAAGPNVGFEYYDLEHSRLRLYGGTTAIWGGRSVALDPIDFRKRDWVAHSGWPISYQTLDPYVDEAFAAVELPRPRGYASIGAEAPGFDPQNVEALLWAFDEKGERFTDIRDITHPRIELVLNANLTELRTGGGDAVSSALFRSLNGGTMEVEADAFVLAAGGIETARLMLACAPDRPEGIGNSRDLVGRYFMEHPHARGGEIIPLQEDADGYAKLMSLAPRSIRHQGKRYSPAFRPSEAAQERLGILNSAMSFGVRRHEGRAQELHARLIGGLKHGLPAKKRFRRLYHTGKKIVGKALEGVRVGRMSRLLARSRADYGLYAVIRAEQAPNPDSRVILTDERDALGVRRAALDWRFLEIDRRSVAGLMQVFDAEMRRMGLGRAEPAPWLADENCDWMVDRLISSHAIGGYHHMGGVRMGASPAEGVCDADCRVFDCPNLYVAGSSLFPTGGWANPTISIMALAMRLGDHLAAKTGA